MTEQELKRQLIHKLREGLSKDYDALYVKEYSTMWETERFLRKSELNIMNLDNALDSILSLLSQRIKAKALTDEQIKSIKKQAFEEWSESPEYSQAWSGGEFSFRQLRDQIYDRAVAAAQLQAVLGELE